MQQVAVVLMILCLTGAAWGDDQPDDDSPAADAVKAYLAALSAIDYDGVSDALCAADLETMDRAAFDEAMATIIAGGYTTDVSDLVYDTLGLGEMLAEVSVTGAIGLVIEGELQPVTIKPLDLGLDRLWAVYEDEAWKACSQVPPELLSDLEPDVIARVFMTAAYRGNYEQAHALICDAEQDSLSKDEFDDLFGSIAEQGTSFSFHETTFDITEQTDESAVVTLTGDVIVTLSERPSPAVVPAENIGLRPVHLVYEEGWKICSVEPVER